MARKPKGRFKSIRGQNIAKEVRKEVQLQLANIKYLRSGGLANGDARRVNLASRLTKQSPIKCNNSRRNNAFTRKETLDPLPKGPNKSSPQLISVSKEIKLTTSNVKNHLPSSKNLKDTTCGDKVPLKDSSVEGSKVVQVGESAPLENSIGCSRRPQFKAMEGLSRKENNINGVNEHKRCPSSVKKGTKKVIDEGVQWQDSPRSKVMTSHQRYIHIDEDEFGDDNDNNRMDVDTNKTEEVDVGSKNHACVEGDNGIEVENLPCGTMKEQRATKEDDIEPDVGDQNPMVHDDNNGDSIKVFSIIMDNDTRNDKGFPCLIGGDGKTDDIKSKAWKESMQEKTNVALGGDGDDDDDDEGVAWLRCGSKNKRKRYIITSDNEEVEVDYVDYDHVSIEGKEGVESMAKVVMLTDCLGKSPIPFISACVEQQCYCCSKPIDEPVWRGTLKVDGKEYTSLVGHLSTKSCEKVWKLSGSLQTSVEVIKLSRSKFEHMIWDSSKPSDDNIGLYFFPNGMRDDANLDQLINEIKDDELVLQAIIGEVEMLIFPSCMLPERYKTFQGKRYLWALFKPKKDEFAAAAKPPDSAVWCAQEKDKGKEHVSNQQDDVDDVEPSQEMVSMKSVMPLESEAMVNLHLCMEKQGLEDIARGGIDDSLNYNSAADSTQQVSASCVPGATNTGFQLKAPDERKQEDAKCQSVHTATNSAVVIAEATALATNSANIPADHEQLNSSSGVLAGRYFFAADRTPRIEQILKELHREVALVFVKPIGAGTGPGSTATTMQL